MITDATAFIPFSPSPPASHWTILAISSLSEYAMNDPSYLFYVEIWIGVREIENLYFCFFRYILCFLLYLCFLQLINDKLFLATIVNKLGVKTYKLFIILVILFFNLRVMSDIWRLFVSLWKLEFLLVFRYLQEFWFAEHLCLFMAFLEGILPNFYPMGVVRMFVVFWFL